MRPQAGFPRKTPATPGQECSLSTPSLGESPFSVRMSVLAVPPSRGAKRKQKPPNPLLPSDVPMICTGLSTASKLNVKSIAALQFAAGRSLHAVDDHFHVFLHQLAIAFEPPFSTASFATSPLVSRDFQRTNRC